MTWFLALPGHQKPRFWCMLFTCLSSSWKLSKLYLHHFNSLAPGKCGCNFNSLWPIDTTWRHKSGSTLAQVMACCLMAPSHYLNRCWLIISKVQWHPSESNFTGATSAISSWNYLENYLSNILFKSPRGQWVKIAISEPILWIKFMSTSHEIALWWMPQNIFDENLI